MILTVERGSRVRMNCVYCDSTVLGADPITVAGKGPAHASCHQHGLMVDRIFAGLSLNNLSDSDLNELSDMVQMEKNARLKDDSADTSVATNDEVELFMDDAFADELWA